jgi:steroid delta-isomerase-like uncharacterized protein
VSSNITSGVEETTATTTGGLAEQSRRLIEESFNEGKFDLIDQLIAPDAVDHDPARPARMQGLRGPEVLRRTVEMYRAAFPDVRMTVDELIVEGDKVAVRWHAEGTHQGELEGLAPTGKRVTVTGINIDHWQDGKIVESWAQWDNLGMARQLGAAPPEGSPVEKVGIAVQRLMASRMRKKNQ